MSAEEESSFRHIPISAERDENTDFDFVEEQMKRNAIRTTKYTLLNWLPKSILEQFRRVANAYFLGISVLMILGTYATYLFISPLDPFSTIATLFIILLVTSCKEGYEDLLRRRSDKFENNREVTVVTFEKDGDGRCSVKETVKSSKRLKPGDIVKLTGTMPAPADLLIILTSMHGDGNKCYVETANIDGETNLKLREAPSALSGELHDLVINGAPVPELFAGAVHIEQPNANIHKVVGTLHLSAAQHPIPIDAQNIVLRSALFSNTDWAYGVVVYAGQETKIQMNSMHAPSKMSKLEKNLNTAIIIIFVAQVSLVTLSVASVYLLGWNDTSKLPYVYPPGSGRGSILPLWLELWFVFFLLYNNFIPMSLYVTIEIVNVGQSLLISADREMYHEGLDVPCTVRASNLVQELGMVSNVFSDKTGTLTRNEMRLVKFVLDGQIYDMPSPVSSLDPHPEPQLQRADTCGTRGTGCSDSDHDGAPPGTTDTSALPPPAPAQPSSSDLHLDSEALPAPPNAVHSDSTRSTSDGAPAPARLFPFLRALMTCHTVVRESNGTYRAESPDELALVQGAAEAYDCCLVERGSREMRVRLMGRESTYAVLAVNPFNADRKRMSVLLREKADADGGEDQYLVVCKGADNIVLPLCSGGGQGDDFVAADKALLQLSNEGLRTLVVAQRYLSADHAKTWLKRHRASMVATTNREEQIAQAAAELERDMALVGATAIEDKLQDEVPEVIADLTKAGIIVWMLTGDKLETAVNIGRSCNLLRPSSQTVVIANLNSKEEFAVALKAAHEKVDTLCGAVTATADGGGLSAQAGTEVIANRGRRSSSVARGQAGSVVLILDGPSFAYFDAEDAQQRAHLLGIGRRCQSVIACRLTPLQKRELVALTKNDPQVSPRATTLAIGDGANDVSMILEANVGVGIFGKEGRQAANSSDFAIGEFKFLRRLLLVHGRYNYVRQSRVFLYSMHKNMVLTMTLFWFSFYTAVSGTSPYESWVYNGFNFILGLPIILYGVMDRDLSSEFAVRYPQVYSTGRTNVLLNIGSILQWILNAMCYAAVVCLMSYLVLFPTFYHMGLYVAGTVVMVGLVLALQCKVAFFHHQWSSFHIFSMVFSFAGMFLYYLLISAAVDIYYGAAVVTYSERVFWLWSLLTVPLTAVFIDWVAYFTRYAFSPTQEMLYRELELQDKYDDLNRLTCLRPSKGSAATAAVAPSLADQEEGATAAVEMVRRPETVKATVVQHRPFTTSSWAQ